MQHAAGRGGRSRGVVAESAESIRSQTQPLPNVFVHLGGQPFRVKRLPLSRRAWSRLHASKDEGNHVLSFTICYHLLSSVSTFLNIFKFTLPFFREWDLDRGEGSRGEEEE